MALITAFVTQCAAGDPRYHVCCTDVNAVCHACWDSLIGLIARVKQPASLPLRGNCKHT